MKMKQSKKNSKQTRRIRTRRQQVIRLFIRLFAWVAVIIIYYFSFSLLFDTPYEHKIRQSTKQLNEEYVRLAERYDSLELILENITAREKGVFRTLFETDPYDLDIEQSEERVALYEKNVSKPKRELSADLSQRINNLDQKVGELGNSWRQIKELGDELGEKSKNIPSIQPVLNKQLTLLTAGYGTILNPFFRTLKSHQGVDYTVAEGSSVFATADGVVKEISDKSSTLGKTVVIDHGNGYQTSYSHLLSIGVRRGQKVQRGDIIALSGNSGLSLAPHLHYEVRYNDLRIDPIHYFYMELSPDKYQRIVRIAQSGMQSFD